MTPPNPRKKAFYANSSVQVLFPVAAAIALGKGTVRRDAEAQPNVMEDLAQGTAP